MATFLQTLFGTAPGPLTTPTTPQETPVPQRVEPPVLTTPLMPDPVPPAQPTAAAVTDDRSSAPESKRIYYVHAPLWGAVATTDSVWGRELSHCAALGCTHVLLSPPWQPGGDGDVMTIADVDRLHPDLGGGSAAHGIAALVDRCRDAGLSLWLDLPLSHVARRGVFAADHPTWLRDDTSDAAPIDPRRVDVDHARAALDWQADGVVDWAIDWISALAASGVTGFRCLAPAALPTSTWHRISEAVHRAAPSVTMMAWTPGCTPADIDALDGAGFDATCSSLPWWDGRATWLFDETARLQRLGRVVAAPEAPFAPRLAARRSHDVHRRALWMAATVGDDLLIPMGFEYGATIALNARHHTAQDWSAIRQLAPFDLSDELAQASAWMAARDRRPASLRRVSAPEATVTALLRTSGDEAVLLAVNSDAGQPAVVPARRWLSELPTAASALAPLHAPAAGGAPIDAAGQVLLAPSDVQLFRVVPARMVLASGALVDTTERPALAAAIRQPRIAIENVTPQCDGGRFPVRRSVGDVVQVEADVWIDGHDQLGVQLRSREHGSNAWREHAMRHVANDRWVADMPLGAVGRHDYCIDAWHDRWATWSSEVFKKRAAGVDVHLEVQEGRELVRSTIQLPAASPAVRDVAALLTAEGQQPTTADDARDLDTLLAPATADAMRAAADRPHLTHSATFVVDAERSGARFASWYELFPRSQSPDPTRHGTFDDVITQLPRVAAMGFDVLYFPPIHPIGQAHRKGRNNSLDAGPDDPGSPYAIGSVDGGHTAIHPALGTLDDFRRLRSAAADHGLELALDFAIQCSPDHPWLREHPEWFMWRPDGTVRYAENPPKKYEDIVNVDFYSDRPAADGSPGGQGLWRALRDAVLFWADEGVRLFRVDNPHTKPLPFWEWLIAEVRGRHPDAVFLAEAFTRPKMMSRLGKVGFSQSYSYFTWRNTKSELTEYLTELQEPPWSDVFRPHFFVNTPDINPHFLQTSGRPGFLIRAALATTLSGLWGMYSGFEVCDALPHVVNGVAKEEYGDSEKYQYRQWDWNAPGNIVAEVTRLNTIRRENPALRSHLGVRFYAAHNDNILFFAKYTPGDTSRFGDNVVLVVVNLDPHAVQEADIELPLWEWGLPDDAPLRLHDLMNGTSTTWHGKHQHVRLDPWQLPFAIWRAHPLHSHPHTTA